MIIMGAYGLWCWLRVPRCVPKPSDPWVLNAHETEQTVMRAPIRVGIASWAIFTLGCISCPQIAHAQLRGVFGQGGMSSSSEAPLGGGPRGNGGMLLPGPFPLIGGM